MKTNKGILKKDSKDTANERNQIYVPKDLVLAGLLSFETAFNLPEWVNKLSDEKEISTAVATSLIQDIAPRDPLEYMLASQMASVHFLSMELSRRAMHGKESIEGLERNVNLTTKLMRTFATQMDMLGQHRGRGQQQVEVRHVHVNDGGQAIIGNVTSREGGDVLNTETAEPPHAKRKVL